MTSNIYTREYREKIQKTKNKPKTLEKILLKSFIFHDCYIAEETPRWVKHIFMDT